ncbi:MAG TPA: GntR family transcriptional regulator [Rhodocyclaceae bacterium]|nr:GntR family transcriptional regulator [Rhodocyclaceae bacterium]
MLESVERQPALKDRVYQMLRSHLRRGTIAVGQPLQEAPLAEQLGVSRTPVRQALTRLAGEGLLVSDGRSFVVPTLTRTDVDDIYEIRFLIEPAAMRRIAPLTADAAVRAPIEQALAAARTAHEAGDTGAFREANVRFRAAWLALVPNRRLVHVIEQYSDHMQHIRTVTLGEARVRAIVLNGLTQITRALAAGDGEAVAAATLAHLGEAKRAFIAAVEFADGMAETAGASV